MPIIGNTGKFDQIYLARLDPQNVENEVRTIENIFTGDLEASNVFTSNIGLAGALDPTHNFEMGSNLFMDDLRTDQIALEVKKRTKLHDVLFVPQIAINNDAPQYAIDVFNTTGSRVFFVDVNNPTSPVNVTGGVAMSKLTATSATIGSGLRTVVIDPTDNDNMMTVSGNLIASKVTAIDGLSFGSNIELNDTGATVMALTGNVQMVDSLVEISGNVKITGNLEITDYATYTQPTNLAVENPVIQVGVGATNLQDTAVLFHQYNQANAFVGYLHDSVTSVPPEFVFGLTQAGPDFVEILAESTDVNVHVLGKQFVDSNIGIANTNPYHQFALGSNLYMEDTGSNVLHTSGNIFANYITVGEQILLGSNVVIDDDAATVLEVTGNAQFSNLYTSERVIIANTNPAAGHSLCIGDKLHAHAGSSHANVLVVHGNTVSTNLIATSNLAVGRYNANESLHVDGSIRIGGARGVDANSEKFIKSTGQIVVHANDFGTDNAYTGLILKSGPTASKVSAVEVHGSTSADSNVVIKTNNAERVRVAGTGYVGIANTAPTQALTVGGNIQITDTNALVFGNAFSTGNIAMRMYSDTVSTGRTYLQSRVTSGESFNINVTSASGLGTPKMTITDTGRVGIGSTTPEGILQTNGGQTSSVFINKQVVQRGSFTHDAPLVATNTHETDTVAKNTLQLCREGKTVGSEYGQRVDFKLSKFASGTNSRTKLDIDLAHSTYDAIRVMTIRSDGHVGIGTENPTCTLQVAASGNENITENGLYVKNENSGEDSIATIETVQSGAGPHGDAFTSYAVYNEGVAPFHFGWTVGVDNTNGGQKHFRITNNVFSVSNVESTAFYIDGDTSNIGIGTDSAVSKFTVDGDITLGQKLSFGGLTFNAGSSDDDKKNGSYDFEHTFLEEREYTNSGRSELLLFKGNDFVSGGPDHIRHVAGRHLFQVYRGEVDDDVYADILDDVDSGIVFESTPVMTISGLGQNKGRVLVNLGAGDEAVASDFTSFFIRGELLVKPLSDGTSRLSTTYMNMLSDDGQNLNIVDSIEGGYDLIFKTTQIGADTFAGDERMRIDSEGLVGIGTGTPDTNVHIYTTLSGDVDVLKVESPADGSGTSTTGIQIVNDDNYGALVRGYRDADADVSGLILGTTHGGVESEYVYLTKDDKLGINISSPDTGFHTYNITPRIEHVSSNAMIEFKTYPGGTSNIQMGTDGDIFLSPKDPNVSNVFINGNLRVTSNIQFDGVIDFGAQAGLGVGTPTPATSLDVNGGCILNGDNVARKSYSSSFYLPSTGARDIILQFGKGHFYAKVKAILREASNGNRVSTMVLEVSGGHSSGSQATYNPVLGTKNMFGNPTNPEPWDPNVTTQATSVGNFVYLRPINAGVQGRTQRSYYYDVYVKVISSNSEGKLAAVLYDTLSVKTIQTFSY